MDPHRWAKIESLYHAALAKAPAERGEYLAAACEQEPEMRQEVESLLRSADEPLNRIGPYQILGLLGAGGMGEVYRARDSRLKREVALKVLPEAFATNPARMMRFQREAEVLASINHPNIAQVYGLEDRAIVMELVEGETLACPLPFDTALDYARQIAEALEYAHEKGIIHRDLKPANIKVTPEGVVKLLDFGLAKAIEGQVQSPADPSRSPTVTAGATEVGMILGTAAYMSPEQATGKPADRRADIWSFGAVFYEMLTGKRAFEGESVSETLASVLKVDPDWNALPKQTPDAVQTLIRRCLTRDRKQRLQAIGEARIVLENPGGIQASATNGTRRRAPSVWMGWITAAVLFATLATVSFLALRRTTQQPRDVVRLTTTLPIASMPGPIAFSPDGSLMAFVGGPNQQIYVRRMDQLETRALPGTEQASLLCFSPDGKWISFIAGPHGNGLTNQLKKIAVDGGPAQTLADTLSVKGPPVQTWGQDGNIFFLSNGVLMRIASGGGKAETLATPEAANDERYYAASQLLPGGQNILFTIGGSVQRLAALNLKSRQKKILLERAQLARYLPTGGSPGVGHLVYYDLGTGSLLAVSFNANRLEVKGSPIPVLDRIRSFHNVPFPLLGISETGTLAYVPGAGFQVSGCTLVWMDQKGAEQPVPAPPRGYFAPRLSPDGKRIALSIRAESSTFTSDIWIYDVDRGALQRITSEGYRLTPIWTPDGKRLIYQRLPAGDILSIPVDGSAPPIVLASIADAVLTPSSVSPDGKRLLGYYPGGGIWELPLSEASAPAKPRTVLESRFAVKYPEFSPDGHWVAFTSLDTGRQEIYVSPYPGFAGKIPISTEGGTTPRWARDGRELFYSNGTQILAVDIQTSRAFHTGAPKVLFETPKAYLSPGLTVNNVLTFDVSPDGKRFLMVKPPSSPQPATDQVNIVLNWFEELRRRVPE